MVRNCSFLLAQEETPKHNMDSWCRFTGVNILHHQVASGVLSGSRFWGPRASRGPERALKSASQCPLVHCDPHSIPHCPLFQLETAQIVEQWQLHQLHESFSNWCTEKTRTDHLRRARLSSECIATNSGRNDDLCPRGVYILEDAYSEHNVSVRKSHLNKGGWESEVMLKPEGWAG